MNKDLVKALPLESIAWSPTRKDDSYAHPVYSFYFLIPLGTNFAPCYFYGFMLIMAHFLFVIFDCELI